MSIDKISMQRLDSIISNVNTTTDVLNNISKNQNIPLPQKQMNKLVKDLAKLNHMAEKSHLNTMVGKSQILEKMDKSLEEALKAVALFKSNASNTPSQGLPSQRNFGQTVFAMINHLSEEMRKLGKSLRELKERKKIKVGQKVEKTGASKKSKEKK